METSCHIIIMSLLLASVFPEGLSQGALSQIQRSHGKHCSLSTIGSACTILPQLAGAQPCPLPTGWFAHVIRRYISSILLQIRVDLTEYFDVIG